MCQVLLWPSACACEDGPCNLWSPAPARESRMTRISSFTSFLLPLDRPSLPARAVFSCGISSGWDLERWHQTNSLGLLYLRQFLHFVAMVNSLFHKIYHETLDACHHMTYLTYHSKLGMPCSPFDTFHRLESYTKSGLER